MRKPLLILLAAVFALLAAVPALSGAAAPPSQSVTVPPAGDPPVTVSWTGSIAPGANPTSQCPTGDTEELNFTVPAGRYDTAVTEATFKIEWTPVAGNAQSDEILTVNGPDGASGSSDGSGNSEVVTLNNPKAGRYTAIACAFVSGPLAQPYTGSLTLRSSAKGAGEASVPSAPADGLSFTASVPSDPQRDESEPNMEIDRDGNIYTCGPTGFTNAAEYAQISTDGGDQFHLMGEPPRGQQGSGGGGDCGLATGADRNAQGLFQYAYTGLGPLTGFTTSTSPDAGRTIATAGPQGNGNTAKGGLADRQWMAFLDDKTVLLSYNQQQPRNIVVQKSTNGGLTYNDVDPDPNRQGVIASPSPNFPGPMRSMPANLVTPGATGRVAYYGWNSSSSSGGTDFEQVNFAISDTTGLNWKNCLVAKFPVDDVTGLGAFTVSDNDREGNIYLTYNDQKKFHSYLTTLTHDKLAGCSDGTSSQPTTNPGWSTPVQVDRDNVRTTVFPWLAAGGAPGRVAVSFYGTESEGDPNTGAFKASWDVYVNQSTNALASNPAVSQVKATTHPFHYDSVCLLGLGCDLAQPPGDRSLADFFAIAYSAKTNRLSLVYNQSAKRPDDATGRIATPAVVTQNGGPGNGGGSVDRIRPVLNASTPDPAGDAIANYSALNPVANVRSPNSKPEPAADLRSQAIGRQVNLRSGGFVPDGGFTVQMKLADLSDAALNQALTDANSGSLLYTFRFVNGYQAGAATAFYSRGSGFTFGYNDYSLAGAQCGSSGDKCQVFPGDKPIEGAVDQRAGTITMTVPRSYLRALQGPTGDGQRPLEVKAVEGSRFYDATAFTLANTSPDPRTQSFLAPLDNAPATDFLLPGPNFDAAGNAQAARSVNPGAGRPSGTTPSTPTACAASAGFRSVSVRRRGRRGAQVAFTRNGSGKVSVDVFQQSRGRRVLGERLVARFRNRSKAFTWNGRSNGGRRRVADGYLFARFKVKGPNGTYDVRRLTLRRAGGRISARKSFYRRATCDLLPSFKLSRPVFGGSGRPRALGIAYRVADRSKVTVTVLRGSRTVRRFKARTTAANRTARLSVPAKGLRRGDYTVRITAVAARRRLTTSLTSRRL